MRRTDKEYWEPTPLNGCDSFAVDCKPKDWSHPSLTNFIYCMKTHTYFDVNYAEYVFEPLLNNEEPQPWRE